MANRRDFVYYNASKDTGLENPGLNICYMNACLQLLWTTPIKEFIGKGIFANFSNEKSPYRGSIVSSLAVTIEKMSCGKRSYFCEAFLDTVAKYWSEYVPKENQDCQEFMAFLLYAVGDEVQEESPMLFVDRDSLSLKEMIELRWSESPTSAIHNFFGIQLVTTTCCVSATCSYTSLQSDASLFWSIDIPDCDSNLKDNLKDSCSGKIAYYAKCPGCKLDNTLKVTIKLGHLPPYLIIHLKRFATFFPGNISRKITKEVKFETEMDLQDYVMEELNAGSSTYQLIGAISHKGSMHSGHYVAYCKREKRWLEFDDSNVSSTTSRKVLGVQAYLLVYASSDITPCPKYIKGPDSNSIKRKKNFSTNEAPKQNSIQPSSASSVVCLPALAPPTSEDERLSDNVQFEVPGRNFSTNEAPKQNSIQPISASSVVCLPALPPPTSEDERLSDNGTYIVEPVSSPEVVRKESNNCSHVPFNLDTEDPVLSPSDVPNGVLDVESLEKCTVTSMQSWLKFRGLRQDGLKSELIERIRACVRQGKGRKIFPGADKGKWHKKKRTQLKAAQDVFDENPLPLLPMGEKAWKPFPSVRIPETFNEKKLREYYSNVPKVMYSHAEGVTAMLQSDGSESDSDSESELFSYDYKRPQVNFSDLCTNTILKCIDRGKRFLRAGHVLSIFDCQRGEHYMLKAQVKASMKQELKGVSAVISKNSGDICDADCSCKASALKRCAHIAAVLCLVLCHIDLAGCEAITTTGRPCYWWKNHPGRNPGYITEKSAYRGDKMKILFERRVTFDPRPSKYQNNDDISHEKLKKFKELLNDKLPNCLWSYHLQEESPVPQQDNEEEEDNPDLANNLEELAIKCSRALWILNRVRNTHAEPFEIDGTQGQRRNPDWLRKRAHYAPASDAAKIIGLTKESAKIAFLRKHVWGLDRFESYAMTYGNKNEDAARIKYAEIMRESHPDIEIVETGSWVNPKYSQLSCSPDGIVLLSPSSAKILLEIKCIAMENVKPESFDTDMTSKQLQGFYIKRQTDGSISMNESHRYYCQIQQSLCILELEMAHLFVYSSHGQLLVEVPRDEAYYKEKRIRLIARHRQLIVPEHFLKRTIRHLPPIELVYDNFHEHENDDYFESHA